jgi:hypothetical protein
MGRRRPVPRERSLAMLRPDLAVELHPTRALAVLRSDLAADLHPTRTGGPRCSARRPVPREHGELDPYSLGASAPIRTYGDGAATAGGNGRPASPAALTAPAVRACAKRRGALKRSRGQAANPSTPATD